ncbi:MAG TPA: VWA domain-containing protein, partial [Armatimonadota bacterium]|nr:VWA domain-containing protein [Armatimonadota bacterium]
MLNVVLKPHRTSLLSGSSVPQKVFAMLKLIPQGEVAAARPPLALALVVDTSGSMREFADQEKAKGEAKSRGLQGNRQSTDGANYQAMDLKLPTKLDQAVEAAHRLLDDDRLQAGDQVTIVRFDDNASSVLPLSPLGDRKAAHAAIDSLHKFSGGTHMGKGMRLGREQLAAVPAETAKRLILLTDGKAFDEDACRGLAPELATGNTPVIAIGIGVEYNDDLMRDLSQVTQGRPYHLQTMEQLREILDAEVGASVKEVVTDLQASIATVRGVTLDSFTRVYPSLSDIGIDEQPYRLGNIPAGDYSVFVLELSVAGVERPPSRARMVQVGLTGHVPGLSRRDELPPQDLFLDFTTDQAAVAAVDPEVLGYVQQKNVDKMVHDAVRVATVDAGRARQTLQVARNMTQKLGNAGMTQMLDNALNELNKTGTISANTGRTVAL